jgi:5-methylcytosine-specific restriction endonuclease McrA
MDADFIATYPTTDNATLAARYGVSPVTILKWARRLGLRKTPEHWAEAQRRRMLGRRLSAETRAKISAKAVGRAVSAETKAKILQTKLRNGTPPKGEKHYKWRGGQTWQRFKDPRYISWRSSVLERDGYTCRQCRRRCKKYERGLAAHHVEPYATRPELRFEVSNGVTLCRTCHLTLHRPPSQAERGSPLRLRLRDDD